MPNWLTLGITLTGLTLAATRLSGLSLGAAFAGSWPWGSSSCCRAI